MRKQCHEGLRRNQVDNENPKVANLSDRANDSKVMCVDGGEQHWDNDDGGDGGKEAMRQC